MHLKVRLDSFGNSWICPEHYFQPDRSVIWPVPTIAVLLAQGADACTLASLSDVHIGKKAAEPILHESNQWVGRDTGADVLKMLKSLALQELALKKWSNSPKKNGWLIRSSFKRHFQLYGFP